MSIIHQAPSILHVTPAPTIPPFEQGLIRINSIGNTDISPSGGEAEHNIAAAANVLAGDELWVVTHASGTLGAEVSGNWTQHFSVRFDRFRTWRRVATADSDDDFVMPTHVLFAVAKMWSLREFAPFDVFPSAQLQGGFLNTDFDFDWEVGFPPATTSMAENTSRDPSAFVYLFAMQQTSFDGTPSPTISSAPTTAMETIMEEAHHADAPAIDTLWTLVNFQYNNPGIEYETYVIDYTPTPDFAPIQWTQHQRFFIA